MALDPISVWLLRLDDSSIDRRSALARYDAFLDDAERRRALSYMDERSGALHIFGRVLLQAMLRQHLSLDTHAERCKIIAGHGIKPSLAAPFDRSGVQFSLSHSGFFVICAMTAGRQVGIDIESLSRNVDYRSVAASHFTDHENADILKASRNTKRARFFYYWTLKEAYLKAQGLGIAERLDNVSFVPQRNNATVLLCDASDGLADDRWGFHSFGALPGCVAALCWQRKSSCFSPSVELRIIDWKELDALTRFQSLEYA
jgi:4'-phosphopantetheinyl transferase